MGIGFRVSGLGFRVNLYNSHQKTQQYAWLHFLFHSSITPRNHQRCSTLRLPVLTAKPETLMAKNPRGVEPCNHAYIIPYLTEASGIWE